MWAACSTLLNFLHACAEKKRPPFGFTLYTPTGHAPWHRRLCQQCSVVEKESRKRTRLETTVPPLPSVFPNPSAPLLLVLRAMLASSDLCLLWCLRSFWTGIHCFFFLITCRRRTRLGRRARRARCQPRRNGRRGNRVPPPAAPHRIPGAGLAARVAARSGIAAARVRRRLPHRIRHPVRGHHRSSSRPR